MKPIIEIKNISKKYNIKEVNETVLIERLTSILKNPLLPFIRLRPKDSFWALKNINLNVNPGEVIGIIGKNGAGKSTLLKLLSRITPPTEGEIILRGRVASLLEVGTGFHPELTGRENIYLNGTILGMTRKEIIQKFDQIVDFAEIHKFLDTPVKHYSSGMYMRLAFAIAAHIEPEILIVDEVLAVGDIAFQKKCLGKMEEVGKEGRTILFVSHNLSAIKSLCKRTVLLDNGKIIKDGPSEGVINHYLKSAFEITPVNLGNKPTSNKQNIVKINSFKITDQDGKTKHSFDIKKPLNINIDYQILKKNSKLSCNIQLINSSGLIIFNSTEEYKTNWLKNDLSLGYYKSVCQIPENLLAEGLYTVRITINVLDNNHPIEIDFPDALSFNAQDLSTYQQAKNYNSGNYPGVIKPNLKWKRISH